MLVTEDLVFLHIPKTGGTFIQTVLGKHLRVLDHESVLDDRTWSHTPYSSLPLNGATCRCSASSEIRGIGTCPGSSIR